MIVITLNQQKNRYLIKSEQYPISQYLFDALNNEINSGSIPKTDVRIKASIGCALKSLDYIPNEGSFKVSHIGYCCDDIVEFCI